MTREMWDLTLVNSTKTKIIYPVSPECKKKKRKIKGLTLKLFFLRIHSRVFQVHILSCFPGHACLLAVPVAISRNLLAKQMPAPAWRTDSPQQAPLYQFLCPRSRTLPPSVSVSSSYPTAVPIHLSPLLPLAPTYFIGCCKTIHTLYLPAAKAITQKQCPSMQSTISLNTSSLKTGSRVNQCWDITQGGGVWSTG